MIVGPSGVTRGGQVSHPWKVWGKFWKEGEMRKKGRKRGKERKGKREARKKWKMEREQKGKL